MAHEDDGDDEPRYWPRPTMPVRVSQTQGKGRGLFATRDIIKGEEIFGENPLVWGKQIITEYEHSSHLTRAELE